MKQINDTININYNSNNQNSNDKNIEYENKIN